MAELAPKKKCRQYDAEYIKYGFVPSPSNQHNPMCLLCDRVFSNEAMKPSRLSDHLLKVHTSDANRDIAFFKSLQEKRKNRSIFTAMSHPSQQSNDGMRASYNLSLLIAKAGKPHNIGETLILPAVKEVLGTVIHHKAPEQVIKSIPLSNNTVRRRVDEMAENIEATLCTKLQTTEFSLQIDESTLPDNESLLLGYVRYISNGCCMEELLFARKILTNKTGKDIFDVVVNFFREKGIPLKNIIACATDGEPAMTGRHRGFLAFLKKAVPDVFTIHCVIHRQHLVAKNLSGQLHETLNIVIKSVNKIKAHALNSRLFRELCNDHDEEFNSLVLHTEVRWLSKGHCLGRFFVLFDRIVEFLQASNLDLSNGLKNTKHDVAYLTDIFSHLNITNKCLQGNDINLISAKSVICMFMARLLILKSCLKNRQYNRPRNEFSCLNSANKEKKISDASLQVYCDHLDQLHKEFSARFTDLTSLTIPEWVMDPFMEVSYSGIVDDDLIMLQNDFELHAKFKLSPKDFWLQTGISEHYPTLWNIVKIFFIAFPTSYLVERGFSAVAQLLGKQRQSLKITERGDLRLFLTNIEPDIEKLMSSHQIHPAHGKPAKAK